MKKYYATIIRKDGTTREIGAYSEAQLQRDLRDIHRKGIEDLDQCRVHIYTVEI